MEQNIHMHIETIKTPQISIEFHKANSATNGETKNESHTEEKTPSIVGKPVFSCDIFSPGMIDSYSLQSSILVHTSIQESHRAKMHMWIMQNCHIRGLSYKTASLACYILDLYFSKGFKCSLEELHEYGISCLRIANKLEENTFIPINYDIFSRQNLIDFEAQICLKLNFQLNPLTFTDISACLNYLWNAFREEIRHNGMNSKNQWLNLMTVEDKGKIIELELSFILFHQTLQLLYLILDTLAYSVDHLVFNTFYMILCLQFHGYKKLLTSSKIHSFMKSSDKMNKIMKYFLHFCRDSNYQLNLQINESCLMHIYSVYNALVSQDIETKGSKDREINFDPNDESLKLSEKVTCQTLRFKNKKSSLKKYLKRQSHQNLRKCSEMTHL